MASRAMKKDVVLPEISGVFESKQFQVWTYECWQGDEGHNNVCGVSQKVTDAQGAFAVRANILLIEREGVMRPRLQVIVPLGTFLPFGLSMHLAPQEPFTVPFQFCNKEGCFINLDLAEDVILTLKNAQNLHVSYHRSNREMFSFSINLSGFSDALSYLIAHS